MRTLFFISCCFFASHLFSQEKQLEQYIGYRGNKVEVHTVSDNAKHQCGILVANEDSIRVTWINSRLQVAKQYTIARGYNELLLGGFIKEGKMYLYNQNPEVVRVHAWVLDSATDNITEAGIPIKFTDENIAGVVNCGNHFVYLTVSPKTAEFIVYDFTNERELSTFRYKFDQATWDKLVKTAHLKKNPQIGNIELEGEGSFELAACANKLYSRNDTLLLLMNNELKETNVYYFDLKNKKVTTRTIPHFPGFPVDPSDDAADNSFLVQDKLLYVRVAKDSLGVQILNFNTGEEIAAFRASAKDSLWFKNSRIVNEPVVEGLKAPGVDQLYRRMLRNHPLIMATQTHDHQLAITIGSSSSTDATARGHGFIPIPLFIPGVMFPLHLLIVPTGSQKAAPELNYFSMLVDADSCKHVAGGTPPAASKKIEFFSRDLNIPPLGEAVFMINGGLNYVYYDKKGRLIMVFLL